MIAAFLLFLVLGAVAISEQLRKQMKHHFLAVEASSAQPELLGASAETTRGSSIEALENAGWNKIETHRFAGGSISVLERNAKKKFFIKHHHEQLGVDD